jgi:hypothetical protein
VYWECGKGVYCETLTKLENSFRKKYYAFDPNFPERLLQSGEERTVEFISHFLEAYSKRSLTIETDRRIAILGLEASIANALSCQSRYGIFGNFLHRNLLWQRLDGEKTERINYNPEIVPSWSWMAYGGGIRFMDIKFQSLAVDRRLRFDEHKHALNAELGDFKNCSLEKRGTSYDVLDASKVKSGEIWYDIETGGDFHAEQCVFVGKSRNMYSTTERDEKCYILVVRPTGTDDEYSRVGVGWIRLDLVGRQKPNVRVV